MTDETKVQNLKNRSNKYRIINVFIRLKYDYPPQAELVYLRIGTFDAHVNVLVGFIKFILFTNILLSRCK